MNENYRDQDGTPCTLEWLVRHEPEWAASRIRIERSERELLTAEVERLKAALGAITEASRQASQVIGDSVRRRECQRVVDMRIGEAGKLIEP